MTATIEPSTIPRLVDDQYITLTDVSWAQYEQMLAMRGDKSVPRMTYLEGSLELMSPSREHERIKSLLRRLVETYAIESRLKLNAFGQWTLKNLALGRGLEPDECYVLGAEDPERPDLAIEVVWTHGGLDKLEVYKGLGVLEVWVWRAGQITVHRLEGDRYVMLEGSQLMPDLDLAHLASCLGNPDQTEAILAYQTWLRARP